MHLYKQTFAIMLLFMQMICSQAIANENSGLIIQSYKISAEGLNKNNGIIENQRQYYFQFRCYHPKNITSESKNQPWFMLLEHHSQMDQWVGFVQGHSAAQIKGLFSNVESMAAILPLSAKQADKIAVAERCKAYNNKLSWQKEPNTILRYATNTAPKTHNFGTTVCFKNIIKNGECNTSRLRKDNSNITYDLITVMERYNIDDYQLVTLIDETKEVKFEHNITALSQLTFHYSNKHQIQIPDLSSTHSAITPINLSLIQKQLATFTERQPNTKALSYNLYQPTTDKDINGKVWSSWINSGTIQQPKPENTTSDDDTFEIPVTQIPINKSETKKSNLTSGLTSTLSVAFNSLVSWLVDSLSIKHSTSGFIIGVISAMFLFILLLLIKSKLNKPVIPAKDNSQQIIAEVAKLKSDINSELFIGFKQLQNKIDEIPVNQDNLPPQQPILETIKTSIADTQEQLFTNAKDHQAALNTVVEKLTEQSENYQHSAALQNELRSIIAEQQHRFSHELTQQQTIKQDKDYDLKAQIGKLLNDAQLATESNKQITAKLTSWWQNINHQLAQSQQALKKAQQKIKKDELDNAEQTLMFEQLEERFSEAKTALETQISTSPTIIPTKQQQILDALAPLSALNDFELSDLNDWHNALSLCCQYLFHNPALSVMSDIENELQDFYTAAIAILTLHGTKLVLPIQSAGVNTAAEFEVEPMAIDGICHYYSIDESNKEQLRAALLKKAAWMMYQLSHLNISTQTRTQLNEISDFSQLHSFIEQTFTQHDINAVTRLKQIALQTSNGDTIGAVDYENV